MLKLTLTDAEGLVLEVWELTAPAPGADYTRQSDVLTRNWKLDDLNARWLGGEIQEKVNGLAPPHLPDWYGRGHENSPCNRE